VSALAFSPVRGRDRSKPTHEKPAPRLLVNAVQFCAWIAQAQPGDRLEYHRGLLALDASVDSGESKTDTQRELNCLACCARWAAEQGLVHLVQRRLAPDQFVYLAIARPRTGDAATSLSSLLLKENA